MSDVSHGTLVLNSNGSFTYTPGVGFDGLDAFSYRAVFGEITSQATVTLAACTGGPPLFACWREAAYLAKAAELGFSNFRELHEGFEDDSVWGGARSPDTAPSVTSLGIEWRTNHPGPPALNEITTGSGPARTGLWGVYDPDHGWATGSPAACDIDDPPPECLFHDGFTGTRPAGLWTLHGVGGFITGTIGANVAVILDGADQVGFGHRVGLGHDFFGVIDAGAAGFTRFEFRELDGKAGQERLIFGDDFTLLLAAPGSIPALSIPGLAIVGVLMAIAAVRHAR